MKLSTSFMVITLSISSALAGPGDIGSATIENCQKTSSLAIVEFNRVDQLTASDEELVQAQLSSLRASMKISNLIDAVRNQPEAYSACLKAQYAFMQTYNRAAPELATTACQNLAQRTVTLSEQAFQNKDLLQAFTISSRGSSALLARGVIPNFRKNSTEDHKGCLKAINQVFDHSTSMSTRANAK
ncbi:MAG: hypothetical protein V4654_08315 [Bdellovibrionota bacterium]